MNDVATVLLLFVAAGLLVLAGTSIGRLRSRPVNQADATLMAGMTGVAIGFLTTFLWAPPLVLGPVSISAILVATWLARSQTTLVGAFLVGSGLLITAMQAVQIANDLADPAVSIPGWTPVPLGIGVASAILGASLLIAGRKTTSGGRA